MRICITKFVVVCVTTLATLVAAETCDAGPILDWLFPNRAARRAQAQAGTVTFRVPVGAYQPNQSWSGYSPTTSYRTVWASVPVTQYRPVSYVNPLSTSGASVMRPCTTYEWQARRVPYVSYQPVAQVNPAAVATPAMFATPSSAPSCGSGCGMTSYYGATGNGAAPIATEWTTVGSGVSYATPSAAESLSYGASPATVNAGYADGEAFSPISNSIQQSYEAPMSDAAAPVCQSCPATAPAYAQETSPAGTEAPGATPWVPLNQDRTGITPLPADTRPSLTDDAPRLKPSNGNTEFNGPSRYDGELQPVAPPSEGGSRTEDMGYDTTRYYGTSSPIRRPAISRDDRYRQQLRDDSHDRDDNAPENSTYGEDPYRAAPSRSRSVPYLKPIPDLKRQQRSQWDSDPIPSHAEDESAERTAQRAAPQRDAVPINWSQVDIGRQGSLTRVPVQVRSIRQETSRPQTDDEDEGGWRRARR